MLFLEVQRRANSIIPDNMAARWPTAQSYVHLLNAAKSCMFKLPYILQQDSECFAWVLAYLAGFNEHERRRHVDDAVAARNSRVVAARLIQAGLHKSLVP